jgi:predicted methyltransferase
VSTRLKYATCCAAISIALVALNGCDRTATPAPATTPAVASISPAATSKAAIDDAIAAERLPGDAQEDSWRKPQDVLAFMGVRPGMHVLDYFSAGGYFTELLSRAVGANGTVIAYNNAAYLKFAKDTPAQRYGANRLPNVAQLTTPPGEVPLEAASLDAALFVMSYHDLYWKQKDPEWGVIDPAQSLSKLVQALKPGGVVVVVDHVAAAGGDTSTVVDALHRIDPATVRRDFEAAGLVFDGESMAVRNPADDHTKPVFDPAVQHQTDRFIYRFRKPE